MDYQGKYFPDDRDENESKIYRTVKGIFKWTMYGISFLIYAIIFYILINNRDSKILEKNYFAELLPNEIQNENLELFRINTRVFMNDDGSLQVLDIDYSKEHKILEIGVKYNAKKLTQGSTDNTLNYKLYDKNGNTYTLSKTVFDDHGRYGFAKLCFSEVDIDLDSNDLRYDDDNPTLPRSGNEYFLDVVRISDNKKLFTFKIYDNKTTFSKTDYKE